MLLFYFCYSNFEMFFYSALILVEVWATHSGDKF